MQRAFILLHVEQQREKINLHFPNNISSRLIYMSFVITIGQSVVIPFIGMQNLLNLCILKQNLMDLLFSSRSNSLIEMNMEFLALKLKWQMSEN